MNNRPTQPGYLTQQARRRRAATLASVLTVAPAAVATEEPTTTGPTESTEPVGEPAAPAPDDSTTDEPNAEQPPSEPPAPETRPAPEDDEPTASVPEKVPAEETPEATGEAPTTEAEAVEFGVQTIRVGVRIAEGSYVPDGTTAAGSTFQPAYTDAEGSTTYQGCTAEGEPDPKGIIWCRRRLRGARRRDGHRCPDLGPQPSERGSHDHGT